MGIPSHGPGCRTYGYSGECRFCGKETFFFFCNHGTKLLMNSPNYPWVIHNCYLMRYSELIDLITDTFGTVDQTVINRLETIGKDHGWEILPEALKEIQDFLTRNLKAPQHIWVQPSGEKIFIYSTLISTDPRINFYKRFGYEKNEISRQLLGILGKDSFNEIRFRETNYARNELRDYSVLVSETLFKKINLRTNHKYFIGLKCLEVPCKSTVWTAEHITN